MEMEPSFPPSCKEPSGSTKFRGSCDACAKAKVKCGKQQPSCKRCTNQNVLCHYSPRQTYGKRRGASASTPTGFKTPTQKREFPLTAGGFGSAFDSASSSERDPENSPAEILTSGGVFSDHTMALSPTLGFGIDLPSPELEDGRWGMTLPSGDISNGQFDLNPSSHSMSKHWIDQTSFLSTHDQMLDCENDLQSCLDIVSQNTAAASAPGFPCLTASTNSIVGHHQDCTNLALFTLHSLQASSASCTLLPPSSKPNTSPSVDCVLKNNARAITHVLNILDCPCSINPHFALLLTFMSSKILAWYTAILRNDSSNRRSASTTSPSSPEKVTHLPITIGVYRLNGEDQSKMIAQLVLTELRKVEWAVDKFHKRFGQSEGKMDLVPTLESFMKAALKETKDLVAERLNGR